MRKILLIFSLFICIQVSGQYPGIVAAGNRTTAPAGDVEMLTNGALTSGTSWTAAGGFTLASNAATFDDVSAGSILQADADMVVSILPNTAYTLTFDVTGTSGGGIYINITSVDAGNGTATYVGAAEYTNGSKTVNFTTPADVIDAGFRIGGLTAGDSGGTIDNLSLKLQ